MKKLTYMFTDIYDDKSFYDAEINEEDLILKRSKTDNSWTDQAKGTEIGQVLFPNHEDNVKIIIKEFNQKLTGNKKEINLNYSEVLDVYVLLKSYFDAEKINQNREYRNYSKLQRVEIDDE